MSKASRIPFEEAIHEPLLLKTRFHEGLSLPQQVVLKAMYGAALSAKITDDLGWSELDYWTAFQGGGIFNDLGYLVEVPVIFPYEPKSYREVWGIFGRRAGKSDSIVSTSIAYEATCGGHEAHLREGQRGIVFQIAQDLRMARYSLHFIRAALETSPILRKMITNVTADRLDLDNMITIASVPPTLKSVRGFASPVASLDEVGVWYQDSDSANPDYEIYRAMSPGQLQFPDRLILGTSSPWNKAGLLYRYYEAGTGGQHLKSDIARVEFQDVLVVHGPTALMNNPHVREAFLKQERARDPEAFARECLAQFQDSISGFIPTSLIERAVDHGIVQRDPKEGVRYVAALDPAFRRDAFAFTIVHAEGQTIKQDVAMRFKPEHDQVLSPEAVLEIIAPICRAYNTKMVFTDQYQLESLSQLARRKGLELLGLPFTAENKARLYGSLQQLFYQDAIRLLDHPECIRELKSLERELTGGGHVLIKAPSGMHDDMASVTVLAVSQAVHYRERAEARKPQDEAPKVPTLEERCQAHALATKRAVKKGGFFWD